MGMSGTRYQPFYDAHRDAKATAEIMTRGDRPLTLNPSQLALDETPVTTVRHPIAVAAWVNYGPTAVVALGFTHRWTSRAVEVFWLTPNGETHSAWVWANAVERRGPTNEEKLGRSRPIPPKR